MTPESVGLNREDEAGIVMGKHSGRHALRTRMEFLGYALSESELNDVFKRFKDLADKKKVVTDEDLQALAGDEVFSPEEIWGLEALQVMCGTLGLPTAVV